MSARGLSIVDLLGLPPGSTALIPPDLRAELARLAVVDLVTTISADAFIYTGTVKSLGETLLRSSLDWPIQLPLLNLGVPFQLVRRRLDVVAGTDLEPSADGFQLDLTLDRVSIEVPGLRPAKLVPSDGVTTAHLVAPVEGEPLFEKPVRIMGSATLRISSAPAGGAPVLRFVAPPDPLDPDAPTGAVATLGFQPQHFFFGGSDFGMTVDRLLYDDSEAFTPAEIEARGQGPDWRGIAIREATLFMPRNAPLLGDVSTGVRDVLLGSPLGMQGEVRVDFGITPVAPAAIKIVQHDVKTPGTTVFNDRIIGQPVEEPGTDRRVFRATLVAEGEEEIPISITGILNPPVAGDPRSFSFRWKLPDGRTVEGLQSGQFRVKLQDQVEMVGLETIGEETFESPPIFIRFKAGGLVSEPRIDLELGGKTYEDVVSLSGDVAELRGARFSVHTDPVNTQAEWRWLYGAAPDAEPDLGTQTIPDFGGPPGVSILALRGFEGKEPLPNRHVEIEIIRGAPALIGCRAGVFDADGPVPVRSVAATYQLGAFHSRKEKVPASDLARLNGTTLDVPHEALAEVLIGEGDITVLPVTRHVQVLMAFNSTEPTHFVADGSREDSLAVPFKPELLENWRLRFNTGANRNVAFIIVGRTCDIGDSNFNADLSGRRALKGWEMLGGDRAFNISRGERFQWTEPHIGLKVQGHLNGSHEAAAPDIPSDMKAGRVAAQGVNTAGAPNYDGWLFKIRKGGGLGKGDTEAHGRPRYRRVDIHAIDWGQNVQPAPGGTIQTGVGFRRVLVPGQLPSELALPRPNPASSPYRVRLIIRWDSPSVAQLADAIPTQAELTVAWPAEEASVIGTTGKVKPEPRATVGPKIFTLVGGWTYDPRSTATQFSLAISASGTPDGLADLKGDSKAINAVAMALGLGPALLAGIQSTDLAEGAVRAGALVGAIAFAAAYGKDGKLVLNAMKIETRQRAITTAEGLRFKLVFDYTVSIGFDFSAFGITITAESPISIRYRNVGFAVDSSKTGLDAISIVYDDASFDIADPGQWKINGPLGELIRVAGSRAGSGSTWIELDLVFALDLGVVKITGCTLRATLRDGSVGLEFRGFSAAVDVPGVIAGSGSVSLGSGGEIRAGVQADIIPINVAAMASLAFDPPKNFFALEIGVMLPVGIPLAQSGLAIYGFIGRFVTNGKRDLDRVALPAQNDPVLRELGWYELPGQDKYSAAAGQYALGLGVSVGTMPDTGFTFNALGMLAIGFPSPDVVLSVDVSLFQRPKLPAAEKSAAAGPSLRILGIIAIGPNAVVVAVKGEYEIPKVLRLAVPFGAYFPLPGNPAAPFLRIGADGQQGRTGEPVSLTLLPGTLDIKVWAFLMVEARELLDLGGVDDFDLRGFSIGFGAGWTMQWGARPIVLRASAKLLAGMGTKPLTIVAGLFVEGELRIFVVSISVRGEIKALITEQVQTFSGKFCGKVDLFLTSVEKCLDVSFASGTDPGIPKPDHPLTQIDLTARDGSITGRAYRSGETRNPELGDTVWPDTVPVLGFALPIANALQGSAFAPQPAELPGAGWSGSTELKYAFRLRKLVLRRKGGATVPGPLESVWWWPTHRGGVMLPDDPAPSEQEGRQLALLSWHPAPYSRSMMRGGEGTSADPVNTLAAVCETVATATRGCVRGDRTDPHGFGRTRMRGAPATRFAAHITETLPGARDIDDAMAALALAGWEVAPGGTSPLASPLDLPGGPSGLTAAYRLGRITNGPDFVATLGARIAPTMALYDAVLTLRVCTGPGLAANPGRCDSFGNLKPGDKVSSEGLQRGPVRFEWQSPAVPEASPIVDHFPQGGDGGAELWFGGKGLIARLLKPVDKVAALVAFADGEPVTMIAHDANNRRIGTVTATPDPEKPQELVIEAGGIAWVQFMGGVRRNARGISRTSGGSLLRLCLGESAKEADIAADMIAAQILSAVRDGEGGSDVPLVQAWTAQGRPVRLRLKKETLPQPGERLPRCAILRVEADPGEQVARFDIAPWAQGDVAVLALCGTDWQSRVLQQADAAARADTAAALSDKADPATSSERPNLLEPDAEYEIVVGVEWTGWRRARDAAPGSQPPPLGGSLVWQALDDRIFTFRTAALALPGPSAAPVDVRNEKVFDPRALSRHVIGFAPDGTGAPHFLDDALSVFLQVDHIEPMLQSYGRAMRLKLRRTDPPASSLAAPGGSGPSLRPPDLAITVTTALLDPAMMQVADRRFVEAAAAAPCLAPPAIGGRTLQVAAEMAPNAAYDLLFTAPPLASPDEDAVVIARTHFRTSRYRGPAGMLAAMDFAMGDLAVDPRLPFDAMVTNDAAAPASDIAEDAAFETRLRALGLDPWPLPLAPRAVALWQFEAGAFLLRGIMLETDEPMDRAGRMAIRGVSIGQVAATADPAGGAAVRSWVPGTELVRTVRNAATTRAIWMMPAPFTPASGQAIRIDFDDGAGTSFALKAIGSKPRLAVQQGLG